MKNNSVTLLEILVVILIVGILMIIAIPKFSSVKEKDIIVEAEAGLRQLSAAEKFYYLEKDEYYPSSGSETNIDNINQNLKLELKENFWDYLCDNAGCVQASRIGGSKDFRLCITEEDPVEDDVCPSQGGSACP